MSTSKIKSLLVIPLIASAVFLASPAFAKNQSRFEPDKEGINIQHKPERSKIKRSIIGTVSAINGNTIIIVSKSDIKYTVDAEGATIMKDLGVNAKNPAIIKTTDIKVGDTIVVRGRINNKEIDADSISSGKDFHKKAKKFLKKT